MRAPASPRVGSLFSGYGGLDLGVHAVLGGTTAWVSDVDPGACKILTHRYPGVQNLGDITKIRWADVERVDVLTAGFPCQDLSLAGRRAGLADGTRSGLWAHAAHGIAELRPPLVVLENVRGLLTARAGRSPDAAEPDADPLLEDDDAEADTDPARHEVGPGLHRPGGR